MKITVSKTEKPNEMMSTMGCRTYNGADINFIKSFDRNIKSLLNGGGIIDNLTSAIQKDGRGNICPVTIILPTLAMEVLVKKYKNITSDYSEMIELAHYNEDVTNDIFKSFMTLLDKKMNEAKDALIERFLHIASQPAKSATFMWENNVMFGYDESEGPISALRHGTLAVGQIALAETLQILVGTNQTTEKGMNYAKQIEQLFKDNCAKWKEEIHYQKITHSEMYNKIIELYKEKYGGDVSESDKRQIIDYVKTHG